MFCNRMKDMPSYNFFFQTDYSTKGRKPNTRSTKKTSGKTKPKPKIKVAWSATVSCSDLLENYIKCVY